MQVIEKMMQVSERTTGRREILIYIIGSEDHDMPKKESVFFNKIRSFIEIVSFSKIRREYKTKCIEQYKTDRNEKCKYYYEIEIVYIFCSKINGLII